MTTLALTYPYPHSEPPKSLLHELRVAFAAEARTLGLAPVGPPRYDTTTRAGGVVLVLTARCREALT